MKYADIDRIYRNVPLDRIPWNNETPPDQLVDLVETGKVQPCRAIDLGCGAGNYAVYLAVHGFDVTGVDSSPAAITIATENARKHKVMCRFITADLLGDLHEIPGRFDFAFDWEFLHHIFPEEPGKICAECLENTYQRGMVSLGEFCRDRSSVWRYREIPYHPDRYNPVFLVRIRTAGTVLTVIYYP